MNMHAAEFGTAVQGRKHLARIEQALRVERAFQALLLGEIDVAEHLRHQVALLDADAMLAGENAAELDAKPQDIRAERFGLLHLFDKSGKGATAATAKEETATGATGAAAVGAAALGAAGAGAAEAASLFEAGKGAASPTVPAHEPADAHTGERFAAARSQAMAGDYGAGKSSMRWLLWLILALILLALLWWLFHRAHETVPATTAAPVAETQAVAPAVTAPPASGAVDLAAAPAEGSVTIPAGAGVTAETRDGKPVVKVYFDTGKAAVVDSFGATAAGLKAWLAGHAGSSLGVSGYNDKTGNAAANAALSKQRAEAVRAALVASGIAESSVALVKPADTTDTTADNASARRVEVFVR